MARPAGNVESSSKFAPFRLGISLGISRFKAQPVLLVKSLRVWVEAAGIKLQSENRSKRKRVAPRRCATMRG